mmetsp:Transcript_17446/g.35455  ORF Transcript_17446/g.35455 Transcript_17446/m.35455 type:complete len:200 (+) Transcript_17446:114-713(+)
MCCLPTAPLLSLLLATSLRNALRTAEAVVKMPRVCMRVVEAPIIRATNATETGQKLLEWSSSVSTWHIPSFIRSSGVRPSKKMPKSQPPRCGSCSCTVTTSIPAALAARSSSASLSPASLHVSLLRYSNMCVTFGRAACLSCSMLPVTSIRPSMPNARSLATARAPRLCDEAYTTGRPRSTSFCCGSSPGMKRPMLSVS